MSFSSSPSIAIELRTWPRWLPPGVLLLSAVVAPTLSGFGLITVLLMSAIGAGLAVWAWSKWRQHPTRLTWRQDHSWSIQGGGAEPRAATLMVRSWCSPWLLCLKFTTVNGQRMDIVIWRFELSAAQWHQLWLRLRLEGSVVELASLHNRA